MLWKLWLKLPRKYLTWMVSMETDIVVIGAGPIGIFTAFQAGTYIS